MNKPIINLIDNNFGHSFSSTGYKKVESFDYVRNINDFDGVTLFTDRRILDVDKFKSKYKIAWLLESPFHQSHDVLKFIKTCDHKFDMIFCYDENLINRNPDKYKRTSCGGTAVEKLDMYKNDKLDSISIIHSGKNQTIGHLIRNNIIKQKLAKPFGRCGVQFNKSEDVLKHSYFHIVVENIQHDNYYSEKLTDAIACGCFPIYCGSNSINDVFDMNSILTFNNISELERLLPQLTIDFYHDHYVSLVNNFNIVKNEFNTSEDWLFNKYIKDLIR